MRKRINLVLELETDDEDDVVFKDSFIRNDLATEINCASNYYEIIDMKTEIIDPTWQ